MSKPVGIWIRVSTEDQAKGESPEHHESRARTYAQIKDWDVVEIYRPGGLKGLSGKSVMNDPEAQRMLADIKSGKIKALLFSKLARLARNTKELLEFSELFQKYNADLVSLGESIDTSTPAGRMMYTFIAALAQWEREEISARVAASVPIRAKMGKPLGGKAVFGYKWVDKKLVAEPEEAKVRKIMLGTFIEYKKLKTTAKILNERGFRTRNGGLFSDTTVRRLIQDTTCVGRLVLNTKKIKGKGWAYKDKSEWVEVPVKPIVDINLWKKANEILKTRNQRRKVKTVRHPLTGYVICKTCREKIYRCSAGYAEPVWRCRKCNIKIKESELEKLFIGGLKTYQLKPEDIVSKTDIEKNIEQIENTLNVSQTTIQKVQNEIDTVFSLWHKKIIDEMTLKERIKKLEERRNQLLEEIPKLEAKFTYLKVEQTNTQFTIDQVKNFTTLYDMMLYEEKRNFVENLVNQVEIGKKEVTFDLKYISEFASVGR